MNELPKVRKTYIRHLSNGNTEIVVTVNDFVDDHYITIEPQGIFVDPLKSRRGEYFVPSETEMDFNNWERYGGTK